MSPLYFYTKFNLKVIETSIMKYFNTDSTCIFEDFDYFGGDLLTEKSSSLDECRMKCNALEDCKKWTYYTDELCEKCHLKKSNVAFKGSSQLKFLRHRLLSKLVINTTLKYISVYFYFYKNHIFIIIPHSLSFYIYKRQVATNRYIVVTPFLLFHGLALEERAAQLEAIF